MLTQKERSEILALLLKRDFTGISDVVHEARYMARRDKIDLLTVVVKVQGGDEEAEAQLLNMINAIYVA